MKTLIVHIILPSGTRFQVSWGDVGLHGEAKKLPTDDEILSALSRNKFMFGAAKKIERANPETGTTELIDDPNAISAFDHPETVVCFVNKDGKELRRIKGPALPPEKLPEVAPRPEPATPAQ